MMVKSVFREGRGREGLTATVEPVSDVSHSLDETVTGVFYFAPESSDMDVDGPISTEIIMTPDMVEQGIAGEDTAGIARQELE